MKNLRIVYDNAVDRATLYAAGHFRDGLGPDNLATDDKFKPCRAVDSVFGVRAAWNKPEQIGMVALPYTNISPAASIRVRATSELQATNLLRYSEQADNAVWTKTNLSVVANAAVAPDGTVTADKLVESTATGQRSNLQALQAANLLPNTWYSFSRFYKAAGRNFISQTVGTFASQSSTTTVFMNLTTGEISGTGAVRARVQQYPDGWWRLTVTIATNAAPGNISPGTYIADSQTTNNYTGDGVSGVYVWGAQFEVVPSYGTLPASSYFATTAEAATRPLGFMYNWQTYDYDSDWALAAPAPATKLRGWSADKAASAYGYGGGACARIWLPFKYTNVYGLTVALYDPANTQGYVEASRLVIGDYWEPEQGVEQGATITSVDSSKQFRTEAGNLLTDVGTRYKKQSLPMPWLSGSDRNALWDIMVGNGMTTPMFISVHPNSPNLNLEKMHQMYGKLVTTPIMSTPYWDANSATLEFEEV